MAAVADGVVPVTCLSSCLDILAEDTPEDFLYREPAWNPWLYAASPRLKSIVAEVLRWTEQAEAHDPQLRRERRRRPADQATFGATVDSLLSHAAYEWLRCGGSVRICLDNNVLRRPSRYKSPLQSSTLSDTLKLLASPQLGFLSVTPGEKATPFSPGRQTTFRAAPRLVSRLRGITLDDVGLNHGAEIIMLKGPKLREAGFAKLIQYSDTEATEGFRREVRELNQWLAQADIGYHGDDDRGDERDRFMRRYFTRSSWGSGGRLFGGFWQKIKKADRLANVTINSESVVLLDFASMFLALAYAYVGQPMPAGDLYAVTFRDTSGNPRHLSRPTIKKIVQASLNGAKDWPKELRQHRSGLPWSAVLAVLREHHAPIASLFAADFGQSLMFTESEILLDAMLSLKADGIVALPVHDCIVVAESDREAAEAAMLTSYRFHAKQEGRVTVERATT